jgi:prephenate dehydrogenase
MANINEPDTYWDIQTENPNADEIWSKLQESAAELHESVKNKDREKFVEIIAKFKELGPPEEGVKSAY